MPPAAAGLEATRVSPGSHDVPPAPNVPSPARDALGEILCDGAQRLLAEAIEVEVEDWTLQHAHFRDEHGHQQVVRNGHDRPRTLLTGVGRLGVTRPRVLDRRIVGQREVEIAPGQTIKQDLDATGQPVERFCSKILPPYLRKTKAIEELLPRWYLKGISTGDFTEALQALVGPQAAGLSASTITRLLNGAKWLPDVIAGVVFVDGERAEKDAA
ncbi:MAG TPA: hypothetical protein PKK06_09495 [Phycisphaerae bacterium]|nr:hypothetical protein [Phycisphaerae bacterium]HNU45533.1 hypothetical protein [Phycisphaerae bacterium]